MAEHLSVDSLATLMLQHGITRVVICPGSRNAPLTARFSSLEGMECRQVTDERSAGFVALGWIAQCKEPVAVCVTSGSALLNLHPAVAEAAYRQLPLLIISADRPAAWIGQQDGQTLPQPGIFGSLCRKSVTLPEGKENAWFRNRVINEALLELCHYIDSPVHINVPISEPLFGGELRKELPKERQIQRTFISPLMAQDGFDMLDKISRLPKRMILLGQVPVRLAIPEHIKERGFALVGEHLCNTPVMCCRPDEVIGPHPEEREDLAPDLLLTIGGCIISKRLKKLLRAHPPKEHWHLSFNGEVIDTFCCLTHCLEGMRSDFWDALDYAVKGDTEYARLWQDTKTAPAFPYSGMRLTGDLMAALPPASVLHLANSMPVRFAQLFPLPAGIHVECNRGVNGIDGSISSAIGYAMGDKDKLQFLICGDLSFFYDMNALWIQGYGKNLRLLLLNNGGGGIFDTLPLPDAPYIKGTHHASARPWAKACSFEYHAVRDIGDWPAALAALTAPQTDTPVLVEAFTDSRQDAALLAEYRQNN